MKKYNEDGKACNTCIGHGRCKDWLDSIGLEFCSVRGVGYANKKQVEDLLAHWNYFRGRRSAPKPPTNEMKNVEFRKGDKVFDLSKGNGIVDKINKADSPYEVIVYFGSGVIESYTADGLHITRDKNRMLYHGHDLEVIINEKMPVRTKEAWVFVYKNDLGKKLTSIPFDTEVQCIQAMSFHKDGYTIITKPIKIEIPGE